MNTRSSTTKDEYLQILNLAYEVAQSLQGIQTLDPRWPDCQKLSLKLYFHATTVYWLGEAGTKAPIPYSTGKGSWFYDFPSIIVLARAIFETYLNMFEVFFEPASDDEFEFNYALWMLSGLIIRKDFIPSDPALRSRAIEEQKEIAELQNRLKRTKKFQLLEPGLKRKALKGREIKSWKDVAKAAGFGEVYIQRLYAYLSGYVHADGLSVIQITTATSKGDQMEFIESNMRTIMIVLSKWFSRQIGLK